MTGAALVRNDSLAGFRSRLDDFVAHLDLSGYLFTAAASVVYAEPGYLVSEISPSAKNLFRDYRALGLDKRDPIARQVGMRIAPLPWELGDLNAGGNDDLADLVETYGFHSGVSVPIYGPAGLKGSMVVLSDCDAWRSERLESMLKDAVLLALRLADDVRTMVKPGPAAASLSKREQECLKWMAAGKTSAEIACILNITARTVDFHAESVLRKLGCVSRQHAVSHAVREGLA